MLGLTEKILLQNYRGIYLKVLRLIEKILSQSAGEFIWRCWLRRSCCKTTEEFIWGCWGWSRRYCCKVLRKYLKVLRMIEKILLQNYRGIYPKVLTLIEKILLQSTEEFIRRCWGWSRSAEEFIWRYWGWSRRSCCKVLRNWSEGTKADQEDPVANYWGIYLKVLRLIEKILLQTTERFIWRCWGWSRKSCEDDWEDPIAKC